MEQRKCRRCGHTMTRIITQTIEPGGSRWEAYYTCLSCGHKIAAAPAGSRAEPENRALTLEELKAHCAKGLDAEPLWAEFREECAISRWIFAVIPPDVFDRPVLSEWIATDRSEKYGKEWRCWPRKPTSEQMAAAEWEE